MLTQFGQYVVTTNITRFLYSLQFIYKGLIILVQILLQTLQFSCTYKKWIVHVLVAEFDYLILARYVLFNKITKSNNILLKILTRSYIIQCSPIVFFYLGCDRYGLRTRSHGLDAERYLVLSRKRTPGELVAHIRANGGETYKYILKLPTGDGATKSY